MALEGRGLEKVEPGLQLFGIAVDGILFGVGEVESSFRLWQDMSMCGPDSPVLSCEDYFMARYL